MATCCWLYLEHGHRSLAVGVLGGEQAAGHAVVNAQALETWTPQVGSGCHPGDDLGSNLDGGGAAASYTTGGCHGDRSALEEVGPVVVLASDGGGRTSAWIPWTPLCPWIPCSVVHS